MQAGNVVGLPRTDSGRMVYCDPSSPRDRVCRGSRLCQSRIVLPAWDPASAEKRGAAGWPTPRLRAGRGLGKLFSRWLAVLEDRWSRNRHLAKQRCDICRRLRCEEAVIKTSIARQIVGFSSYLLAASCAAHVPTTGDDEWLWVISDSFMRPNSVVERMGPTLEPCLRAASDFIATHDLAEAMIRAGLLQVECRLNCTHTSEVVVENCDRTIPVPIPESTARQSLNTDLVRIRE